MVHEDDVVFLTREFHHRLRSAQSTDNLDTIRRQNTLRHVQIHLVIVHYQNPGVRRRECHLEGFLRNGLHPFLNVPNRLPIFNPVIDVKRKGRPLSVNALYLDRATHHPDQSLADGQSQPGTFHRAVPPRIHLRETGKNVTQIVFPDADAGIADRSHEAAVLVIHFLIAHFERDFTVMRELDRIAQEIDEYLLQPNLIAYQEIRDIRIDLGLQLH